jgi:hypothetical protein
MMDIAAALVVFERTGDHPLCRLLGEFKHVFCAVRDPQVDVWIAYHWLMGRVEIDYLGQHDADDLVAFYEEQGSHVELTWADRRPFPRAVWPLAMNNCVGHTKTILGMRSWAVTPGQLLEAIRNRKATPMPAGPISRWLSLPGGTLLAPKKPKAPAAPPPPPTEIDARVSAARKRQRAAAGAAAGVGGQTRNVGGGLGVSTGSALTTNSTLLGG